MIGPGGQEQRWAITAAPSSDIIALVGDRKASKAFEMKEHRRERMVKKVESALMLERRL